MFFICTEKPHFGYYCHCFHCCEWCHCCFILSLVILLFLPQSLLSSWLLSVLSHPPASVPSQNPSFYLLISTNTVLPRISLSLSTHALSYSKSTPSLPSSVVRVLAFTCLCVSVLSYQFMACCEEILNLHKKINTLLKLSFIYLHVYIYTCKF